MKGATKQTAWELQTAAEEQAEIEAGYLWRASLWSAMRTFAANYIGPSGMKGLAAVAAELDKRWGGDAHGRPVSESTLGAALRDAERNYFRLEWADWFARRSPEVAALLAHQVKPVKTAEQMLADVEAEIRSEMPRRADAIMRNARAR